MHPISILYPYYGNIQLFWMTKIHSISNKGPYNFHSMTFYGFSKFFPVHVNPSVRNIRNRPSGRYEHINSGLS